MSNLYIFILALVECFEQRVRTVLSVEGEDPALFLMNLPAAERFVHKGALNEEAFRDVATKYAAGALQTESLE